MRILVFGLPGAGKSTFSICLRKWLTTYDRKPIWLNADQIRDEYNDWDFSHEGRLRQAQRLHNMSKCEKNVYIVDFVCPTEETRKIFDPDITVFMDTIKEGRYEDTNKLFQQPDPDFVDYTIQDFSIASHDAVTQAIKQRLYGND